MKLYVLSDLHIEFASFAPDQGALQQADVVVLAGDIHLAGDGAGWARGTFGDKPILWVAGNHEFYGGHWTKSLEQMRQSAQKEGIFFLEDDAVDIGGVRFLGTSLWTDFAYFGQDHVLAAMAEAHCYIQDYASILRCTPTTTLERHLRSRAWLATQLEASANPRNTVVITHHAPRRESVESMYQADLCTAAFASHLPAELVQKAGLWIHGHLHASKRYQLGATWGVCNPRGYPRGRDATAFENPYFDPGLLVEQRLKGWCPLGMTVLSGDACEALGAGPEAIPPQGPRLHTAMLATPAPSFPELYQSEAEYVALCERAIRSVNDAVDMNNNDLVELVCGAVTHGGVVPLEIMQTLRDKGHPAWALQRAQQQITRICAGEI